MGQQTSVTLNTVVYTPGATVNGIQSWWNRAGGVLGSFKRFTQRFLTGVGGKKLTKVSFLLEIPTVATSSDACACAGTLLRTSIATITASIDPNASVAERTDLYLSLKDLAASDTVKNAIQNLDPDYLG